MNNVGVGEGYSDIIFFHSEDENGVSLKHSHLLRVKLKRQNENVCQV